MKNGFMIHSKYGPGGRKCVCCGPAPKSRKAFDRMVKRRERQLYNRALRDLDKE